MWPRLVWHCADHTAKLESGPWRPIPYYQKLLFSIARGVWGVESKKCLESPTLSRRFRTGCGISPTARQIAQRFVRKGNSPPTGSGNSDSDSRTRKKKPCVDWQVVSAEDGKSTTTYSVAVSAPDDDALLASLALSQGALSPAFAPGTFEYTCTVSDLPCNMKGGRVIPCNWRVIPCNIRRKDV